MGVTAVTDEINVLAPSTIDEETEDTIGKSVRYHMILQLCHYLLHNR
jgi:hypothetical protein